MYVKNSIFCASNDCFKWGITRKQFAIYVGIAVGFIVIVVTVIMVTMNKLNKSRAKYSRYADEPEDAPIDEEVMRLQIMKEMLEEKQAKGKDSGKKKTSKLYNRCYGDSHGNGFLDNQSSLGFAKVF